MTGIVHGGWGYVLTAYMLTALVLGGYAVRVFVLHSVGKHLSDYEKP